MVPASPPASALAARLRAYGDPVSGLVLEDLPLAAPGPGEVLVRMRRAPINPADLNVIEGTYGTLPTLPATIGMEGAGVIAAVGSGVRGLAVGDVVRPVGGAWCRWTVVPATTCLRLRRDLPIDQAAMLAVNPATAWAVLDQFGPLQPGDVVAVNAATSGVGRSLIALAKQRGLRVMALVRRAEAIAEISALGADAVVLDDRQAAKALLAQLPPARLALNQVGGDSAATLAKVLVPGGWLVTVGAMGRQPFTVGNGPLIFNELRTAGFWVSRWYQRTDPERIQAMIGECAALIRSGRLHQPVAQVLPLARLHEALALARASDRRGKILLDLEVA